MYKCQRKAHADTKDNPYTYEASDKCNYAICIITSAKSCDTRLEFYILRREMALQILGAFGTYRIPVCFYWPGSTIFFLSWWRAVNPLRHWTIHIHHFWWFAQITALPPLFRCLGTLNKLKWEKISALLLNMHSGNDKICSITNMKICLVWPKASIKTRGIIKAAHCVTVLWNYMQLLQ